MSRTLSRGRSEPRTAIKRPKILEPQPTYSGFGSAQMESYYNRIACKMMEFLTEFAIGNLSKGLSKALLS